MGEIADMMIDGDMCQSCGCFLVESLGYPGFCEECQPKPVKPVALHVYVDKEGKCKACKRARNDLLHVETKTTPTS